MMRRAHAGAMLCGVLLSGSAFADDSIVQRLTPRPYGYTIGDLIRHELIVQPGAQQTLDPRSVPSTGPVNRWLELRRVDVLERSERRIRIGLEYQVFYAPLTVKNLVLPGFTLQFQGSGKSTSSEVPAWNFSMAPIHGLAVLDSAAAEPVRADVWPLPPDPAAPRWRMIASLVTATTALLVFAYLRGLIGVDPRGRAFRDAHRALQQLRRQGSGRDILKEGFSTVHRAFDRKLGAPLFAERLPEFFQTNPQFLGLTAEIEGFFAASYGLFFGAGDDASRGQSPAPYGIDRLQALCLACLRAERDAA